MPLKTLRNIWLYKPKKNNFSNLRKDDVRIFKGLFHLQDTVGRPANIIPRNERILNAKDGRSVAFRHVSLNLGDHNQKVPR